MINAIVLSGNKNGKTAGSFKNVGSGGFILSVGTETELKAILELFRHLVPFMGKQMGIGV